MFMTVKILRKKEWDDGGTGMTLQRSQTTSHAGLIGQTSPNPDRGELWLNFHTLHQTLFWCATALLSRTFKSMLTIVVEKELDIQNFYYRTIKACTDSLICTT